MPYLFCLTLNQDFFDVTSCYQGIKVGIWSGVPTNSSAARRTDGLGNFCIYTHEFGAKPGNRQKRKGGEHPQKKTELPQFPHVP